VLRTGIITTYLKVRRSSSEGQVGLLLLPCYNSELQMNTPPSLQQEYEDALARLVESVLFGKAHVVIGQGLSAAVTDPVIAQVAPTFWGMTIYAHFDIAELIAFKLFDEQRNALNIEFLLDRTSGCASFFQNAGPDQLSAIVATSRTQIANLATHLMPIRARRNRIIAHADSTIVRDPTKLAQLTQITFSNLNAIFGTAAHILNDISVAYKDVSPLWPMIGDDDFKGAIQLIVNAKHTQVDRYEEEFGPAPFPRPKLSSSLF
jgi:hypothetical protein